MATFPVLQEREGEWTNSKMIEILGLRILSYFAPDPQLLQDFITNFQTKADDVFIASYPKSGEAVEFVGSSSVCTVEPRFNEPPLNEALDITNDIISMSRPKLQ